MCILIAKCRSARKMTTNEIKISAKNNPDGFGIAYVDNGNVIVHKTFNLNEIISINDSLSDDTPIIYHFRIATHGTVKLSNCHPFYDKNIKVAFAHNGVLSIENDAVRDWTDSETAFRYIIAPLIKAGHKPNSETVCNAIGCIIGTSKFAMLDSDGNVYTYGMYAANEQGLLFSNDSYKEREQKYLGCYSWDDWFEPKTNKKKKSKKQKRNDDEYEEQLTKAYDQIFNELEAIAWKIDAVDINYYADYFYTEYGMWFDRLDHNDFKAIVSDYTYVQ